MGRLVERALQNCSKLYISPCNSALLPGMLDPMDYGGIIIILRAINGLYYCGSMTPLLRGSRPHVRQCACNDRWLASRWQVVL